MARGSPVMKRVKSVVNAALILPKSRISQSAFIELPKAVTCGLRQMVACGDRQHIGDGSGDFTAWTSIGRLYGS